MTGTLHTIIRFAMVGLVALLLAGLGAEGVAADYKRSDFGTKELFKLECEAQGGIFKEDPHGNTECHFGNKGEYIECDANGNDCWVITSFRPLDETKPWEHPDTQWNPADRMAPISGTMTFHA